MIKMKKSNYLVILFAIVIVSGNALFQKPILKYPSAIWHHKKMDHFSVVVAQPGSRVSMVTQQPDILYPTFDYYHEVNELPKALPFGVRNDTLFVFSQSDERQSGRFSCIGVKSIVGLKKSRITVGHLQIDSLNIKLRYARLAGDLDLSDKKPRTITIDADSSKIEFHNYMYYYEQINIRLNRSHLSMLVARKDTGLIAGSLKNYSRLSIDAGWPTVHVMTDETSFNFLNGTSIASTQFPKFRRKLEVQ
jgi:hypothetical protein